MYVYTDLIVQTILEIQIWHSDTMWYNAENCKLDLRSKR